MNVNFSTNTATLTNLTVYAMYIINVSAVSSGGIGPANTAEARKGAEGMEVLRQNFLSFNKHDMISHAQLAEYTGN